MSIDNISEEKSVSVRANTDTLQGMFHKYNKRQLQGANLYLILGILARTLPNAQSLQLFRNSLCDAMEYATERVKQLVKELTLEDYAQIQLLSLNSDGHPLGDYVFSLLSTYFEHELIEVEAVREEKRRIDRIVFDTMPITRWGPSSAFAKAYRASIYAHAHSDITQLDVPPLTPQAAKKSGANDKIVALHFGDLFVEAETKRVYMVATPECDLAFGGSRAFPKDRSVVLVPGRLTRVAPQFQDEGENRPITELFHWDNQHWRIEWRIKNVITIPLNMFKAWAEDEQKPRKRVCQMRFPFAAGIQRTYAADLTRVGLPVPPSHTQAYQATMYTSDSTSKCYQIGAVLAEGADIYTSMRHHECVLRDELIQALQVNLADTLAQIQHIPSEKPYAKMSDEDFVKYKQKCADRAESNAQNLQTLMSDMPTFISLRGPHSIEPSAQTTKVNDWLTITIKKPPTKYQVDTTLLVYLELLETN